ncbi:MAG: SNF2 family N-terminal domain-containing protein [Benjaminiella poitrasii]|nr:MAG: SNF2 family N-terminal domain-containing protein [Benjaminiella poitrasii]
MIYSSSNLTLDDSSVPNNNVSFKRRRLIQHDTNSIIEKKKIEIIDLTTNNDNEDQVSTLQTPQSTPSLDQQYSSTTINNNNNLMTRHICIGMIMTDIVVEKPPLVLVQDEQHEPVTVEYEGKLHSNEYSFRVISRTNVPTHFIGWIPFRETKVIGPIRDLICWEACIPRERATPTRTPLYLILYCHSTQLNRIARYFEQHRLYLKQPPFHNPCCQYYNPHQHLPEAHQQYLQQQRSFINSSHVHDAAMKEQQRHKIVRLFDSIPTFNEKEEEKEMEEEEIVIEGLNVQLMRHQVKGVRWMLDRENQQSSQGGILADMGLGKTIQMIALMTSIAHNSSNTTLVVTPLALIQQWIDEINQKSPRLKVLKYHGTQRAATTNTTTLLQTFNDYHVVVTTYQVVLSDTSLRQYEWYRIVLDEAQYIKNHQAKVSIACSQLKARKRWCLTGTPIQNNVNELYSLFRFLRIEPWSDYSTFRRVITNPLQQQTSHNNNNGGAVAMERLRTILMAVMLRRTKKKVVLETKKERRDIVLQFSPDEQALYNVLLKKTRVLVFEYQKGRYMNMLCLLLRLRQACNHPQLILNSVEQDKDVLDITSNHDTSLINHHSCCGLCGRQEPPFCKECQTILQPLKKALDNSSTKLNKVIEILKETQDCHAGQKTVIFSQFTSMLDLLEERLKIEGIEYCRYDGSMSSSLREKSLRQFKEDSNRTVMLISLKCGSLGLNLTTANRVILMDIWWNPAVEEQAIDRVYRIGQRLPVYVTRLLIDNSIELKILALQQKKAQLMIGALGDDRMPSSSSSYRLTAQEIKALFDF